MVTEKFRHQLQQEAKQWQQEGLINSSLYENLATRYQFGELETSARNRFVMIMLGLGSILLSLAVITFIAANWQVWSRELKVVLLLSLFIIINTAGFYLWRQPEQSWQFRSGQGLLLLGSLVMGANIALMSQMFHQTGPVYQLYLIWGAGVLVMAYLLRSTLLGILATILITISHFTGWQNTWIYAAFPDGLSYQLVWQHLPLVASVALIPLAYWCRSRWIFAISAVLIAFSVQTNLGVYWQIGFIAAIALSLPPGLLWGYQDYFWLNDDGDRVSLFAPIARGLAIFNLSVLFYAFSFHYLWEVPQSVYGSAPTLSSQDWPVLLDPFLLTALTIFFWLRLSYSVNRRRWRLDSTSGVIALMILTMGAVCWWHISINSLEIFATLIFNILLGLLGIGLIREALGDGRRLGFWWGIILVVVQILSRMLEYDTSLVLKAFVLFLCGIGVIAAGLWFERYVRTLRNLPEGS
ncbi:MAG: DUF2157 domain-containing protein [Spirulinaceae cyanobacterium]